MIFVAVAKIKTGKSGKQVCTTKSVEVVVGKGKEWTNTLTTKYSGACGRTRTLFQHPLGLICYNQSVLLVLLMMMMTIMMTTTMMMVMFVMVFAKCGRGDVDTIPNSVY